MIEVINVKTKPVKKKKRWYSPGKIILYLFLLIIVVAAALFFRMPQKIGLYKSPAEQLFTVTPDREKAAVVMADLQAAGLNTQGVEVYVLPVSGTDDNVAMVVLDASKGFNFASSGSADPVTDFLTVASNAQKQGINRAAVVYYDANGKPLVTATLPTDAAVAYSQGKITDRQLMEKVDVGTDDVLAFIGMVREQLK
jgi:hypothetical protein